MQVNMVDGLPSRFVAIHDYPVAILRKSLTLSQFSRNQEHFANQFRVILFNIIDRSYVLLRDDENMVWRLWIDIPERQDVHGFIDDIGRDFAVNDFQKEII